MHRTLIFLFLFSGSVMWAQPPEKNLPPDNPQIDYKVSQKPDRILLTWKGNPSTSFTVTWRTSISVSESMSEIARADASPNFEEYSKKLMASSSRLEALYDTALFHTVTFTGLEPGSKYVYRVGNENYKSEWFQFQTAPVSFEPFRFIYMGDAQNDLFRHWSRVFREAYAHAPDAKFILHAGDLVNHSQNDYEWGEWFAAGSFIHQMIPSIASPGNHEYIKDAQGQKVALSPFWNAQFNFPDNGPDGLTDQCFYFDYPGCRVISLNSNEEFDRQAQWLEEVLTNNPQPWTIVFFHHPIISAARGRFNESVANKWQPLLEKYKVDLVLQGHDHTYARGAIPNADADAEKASPTVYVVSVSGPKMYNMDPQPWMSKFAENTQLFQIIDVMGKELIFTAYTADGKIYDAFMLRKRSGKSNKLKALPTDFKEARTFNNTLKEK